MENRESKKLRLSNRSRQSGLIITADDFGLHVAVNEAVERAHVDGVLDAASLMVAAPAAADAVARARRLPQLAVGLHLVLADGPATLPRSTIPDLVGADGRFGDHMARDGFRFFFPAADTAATGHGDPRAVRGICRHRPDTGSRQRAQAFSSAPNGTVADARHRPRLRIARRAVAGRTCDESAAEPWTRLMRRRLDRAGMLHNDYVFGLRHSGAMNEAVLLDALRRLPSGITEIYGHPATRDGLTPTMHDYRHADELAALLSPKVRDAIAARKLERGGFLSFA